MEISPDSQWQCPTKPDSQLFANSVAELQWWFAKRLEEEIDMIQKRLDEYATPLNLSLESYVRLSYVDYLQKFAKETLDQFHDKRTMHTAYAYVPEAAKYKGKLDIRIEMRTEIEKYVYGIATRNSPMISFIDPPLSTTAFSSVRNSNRTILSNGIARLAFDDINEMREEELKTLEKQRHAIIVGNDDRSLNELRSKKEIDNYAAQLKKDLESLHGQMLAGNFEE